MRIGMMVDVYKPHVSGITNYITLNKKYLEAAGQEVFVFTFGDENFQDDEPNVIRSAGMPLFHTDYYLSLSHSSQVRRLVSTMDVVHVHHPFLSGSQALILCRPRGIPLIFTNHTRYDLYAQAYLGLPDVIGEAALQTYMRAFCRGMDLVIAPSPGMRDILLRFNVDCPIEVVPNGVELKSYRQAYQAVERSSLGFTERDVVLTYTGRLGPEKNLPFLLRCFGGAAQAYDYVRLLIIGDGPERDNLQAQVHHMGIEPLVHFTGMLPYDRVPSYLAMADAFVTASVTEVHPLSVIEAMASGLPILGICSPGVGDTIQDGITGFLIEKEDLAAFTAKMVRMVVDQDLRHQMGQQARQASEMYAIERTTQIMLDWYQKVIQRGTRRKRGIGPRLRRWWDGLRR